jgi:hypothetical protein
MKILSVYTNPTESLDFQPTTRYQPWEGPRDECSFSGSDPSLEEMQKLRRWAAPKTRSQRLEEYILHLGPAACRQNGSSGCFRKIGQLLSEVFPGAPVRQGQSLGPLNRSGAPTPEELRDLRHSLDNNEIPLWLIRGQASGQHWIAVLGVDANNKIRYFDPADGTIHCKDSQANDLHGPFFGSPRAEHLVGNRPERGYRFRPTL